jgi:hypothetical protein
VSDASARWVVVLGADRRYYVYRATLVPGATAGDSLANAAPMFVFSTGSASWRDQAGNWLAGADNAAE